jgi:lysozyme family protein
MKAVQSFNGDLVAAYMAKRLGFLQSLTNWKTFGKGWGRRVDDVAAAAGAMTNQTLA